MSEHVHHRRMHRSTTATSLPDPADADRSTAAPPMGGRSSTHPLVRRLQREWRRLHHRPDAVLQAAGWEIVTGPISDLDQVLTAIGFEVAATDAGESALRSLVLRSAHDPLAARVVLQRLLPGLLSYARRRAHVPQATDELVGAAWIAITTFDPARRPRCLAAALLADADYRAFRFGWRRAASSGEVIGDVALDDLAGPPAVSAADEVADLLADAVEAGLPPADVALLRRLLDTPSTDAVAAELRVTARTVRNRRSRATDRLRELALAA